jgi:hypothetical protein
VVVRARNLKCLFSRHSKNETVDCDFFLLPIRLAENKSASVSSSTALDAAMNMA